MLNEMQRRRPPGLVFHHTQPLRPASPPPGIARGAEANSGFKETKDAATPNASGERPRDPRGDDAAPMLSVAFAAVSPPAIDEKRRGMSSPSAPQRRATGSSARAAWTKDRPSWFARRFGSQAACARLTGSRPRADATSAPPETPQRDNNDRAVAPATEQLGMKARRSCCPSGRLPPCTTEVARRQQD